MNELLSQAIRLANFGWYIFPCRPQQKMPITKNGCKDATRNEDTIKAWWMRWPTANVGVLCGPESNIYVVDVDYDPDKGIDGWDSMSQLENEFNSIPMTVSQMTPRGGAHYFFKTDNPPANKNNFRNGIDIRSAGYYVLLAPSIHPNGKKYQWITGAAPGEIAIADFPDFLRPQKPKPAPAPWQTITKSPPTKPVAVAKPPTTAITDRASLYLSECEPAVQGQAGHDKLLWAATALVHGFELDEATATHMLETEYNPRCVPPWDMTDRQEAKDFRRKVPQAKKTSHSKPRGWLLAEYDLTGNSGMVEYGRKLADGLLESIKKKKKKTKAKSAPAVKPPQEIEGLPQWLLEPPGMVGELCGWINNTSRKCQPTLALGCALAFCSALFGRKIANEWDLRSNVYVMGVARSCAGKEHARSQIKKLAEAAGVREKLLGGEDVTSDAAIELALTERNPILFLWDEVGHMMKNIKANGNSYTSKIVPTLMKLYTSASTTYLGKEYATADRRDIVQPCCSVYGTTTPTTLYDSISSDEIEDGWLGRVLLLISHEDPVQTPDKAKISGVPDSLIQQTVAWAERQIDAPEGTPDITAISGCWQMIVTTTTAANILFDQFEDFCFQQKQIAYDNQDGTSPLWGRARENANKVALIIAAGERYDNPEINEYTAKYAIALTKHVVQSLLTVIDSHVSNSQIEADKKIIRQYVKNAGPKGLSKAKLTRKTQRYSRRQRNDYLEDLQSAEEIVLGRNKDKGNKMWCWPYPYGLTDEKGS